MEVSDMLIVQVISMVVITIFTALNFFMFLVIQNKDEEYKREIRDLFQAIVIANIVGGSAARGGTLGTATDEFKKLYKGQTKIFD